jgi:hypothetical protein
LWRLKELKSARMQHDGSRAVATLAAGKPKGLCTARKDAPTATLLVLDDPRAVGALADP